ncbi:MAG: ABC transporter permease [Anaerolineae bacterium]|nr:ABC transporter permease [Anaerolineae bacterium]
MADSARNKLPTTAPPSLKEWGVAGAVMRYWGLNLLVIALLLIILSVLLVYQNAAPDAPVLLDSTVGQLGLWIADQSALDAPVSILGQYAKNQALASGLTSLDVPTVLNAIRGGLVIFIGLALVMGVVGFAGLLRGARWTRAAFLVVLLLLDGLLFIVPSLAGESVLPNIMLGLVILLIILLGAPGNPSKLLGFIVVISALLVAWEAFKAVGDSADHKIMLSQPGWNYTVYDTLEDTLAAIEEGSINAAVLDKNDVEDLIAEYPQGDLDPASLPYPTLRILADLETETLGFAKLPIIPAFPGRLTVVTREADVTNWAAVSDLLSAKVGTFADSFSNEKFLALPRNLLLLDLRISNDVNLPHLQTIAQALFQPARRNGELLLGRILGQSGIYTWSEAALGFVAGGFLGFVLGALFAHSRLLERGLLPYVVMSQTIPILAIAPMVVIWLGSGPIAVAVISAYLTFFPVTINTLRGLTSPDPTALELMHSYAANWWTILWKLRFPAALPYIFTALKVSATASVVGAVIGELPSGVGDGLGRTILNFNQYYSSDPAKLWAAILVAAVVGIAFFVVVTLAERVILGQRAQGN